MCGIVGYVGPREARPLLLAGLEQLEYRGYDSAGISVLKGDAIEAVRAVGNLSALRRAISASTDRGGVAVAERPQPGTGIGHTRWATHGGVTEENAHPHFDTSDRIHIVVNGIVENYVELKERLLDDGRKVHVRDRRRGDRPPGRRSLRGRPGAGRAQGLRRASRPLRVRCVECRRAGRAGRSTQRMPADHRPGAGRAVHRVRDPRVPARDSAGPVHRERRDRGRASRRGGVLHGRRRAVVARDRRDRLGRRHRREAGLRDVHAQGDPRAGRRGRRDDR